MTNRAASLLMLFVAGLILTGPLLAGALRLAEGFGGAGPWLAPAIAIVCCTLVFFAGRRFILPPATARSTPRALGTLLIVVGGTMVLAFSAGWMLSSVFGRISAAVPVLILWFAALWWALSMLHRTDRRSVAF